ncbi:DUF2750 domain-containing protein [Ferrimonas balearica]|uniref:DUF2750 domain-containing protein n=1 Tax=Ferrimonas balearica TaxID=44012 RepID=UPI001C98F607|nr:DUF2750 domain-containing protein [Ferrimonas balearica]MBY5921119.1 DUF2750 domain-containing protein [Ferrimonas balearica]MBY5996196.1 DUF2750 domain-containing protein [Ferrimonas balearica]
MSDALTQEQINAFYSLDSQGRYDHLVEAAKANQALYTLADDQGCVLINTGKEQCLLLWHHPILVENWIKDDYANCHAMTINLADFVEKWAPGMTKDGFEVGVAPSLAGEAIVVSAEELAADLA